VTEARRRLADWLDTAERAARAAGLLLREERAAHARVTSESGRDLKIAGDVAAEARIVELLRRETGLAILSEEIGGLDGDGTAPGLRWIVDPLDGSVNYQRGIPGACVSVGLWTEDEPVLGVVYDFSRDELFSGIAGVGAWLNGDAVRVAATSERERAVLCTGFPVAMDFSPDALAHLVEQVRAYKKIRMLGSAALSLAYVAAGRADAYFERGIRPWDVAAGLAIVAAAGGAVAREPFPDGTLTVYAGAPSLPLPRLR
jgi:myo-inositol-1(or 4)-monophosphatase